MNDREMLLAFQQSQQEESQAIEQLTHYRAVAVGLAAFCQTFMATMMTPGLEAPLVTRDEVIRILIAAVQGR